MSTPTFLNQIALWWSIACLAPNALAMKTRRPTHVGSNGYRRYLPVNAQNNFCQLKPYNEGINTSAVEVEFMLAVLGDEEIDEYLIREIREKMFECMNVGEMKERAEKINSAASDRTQEAWEIGIISLTVISVTPGKQKEDFLEKRQLKKVN